jgi:hypothetical protein
MSRRPPASSTAVRSVVQTRGQRDVQRDVRPATRTRRPAVRKIAFAAVITAVVSLSLAGCAQTVALDAAPHANNPGCAAISVRLPKSIAGQAERNTDAQGTSAWGDPTTILLRCGVALVGPTTQPCITVSGIDWVLESAQDAKVTRYITFGRDPATEVIIEHTGYVSDASVLPAFSNAVGSVTQTSKCLGPNDGITPSPTPHG